MFSSPERPDRPWSPPSLLFNGYSDCFLGLRQLACEYDLSPPSNIEVNRNKNYTSTSPPPNMPELLGKEELLISEEL